MLTFLDAKHLAKEKQLNLIFKQEEKMLFKKGCLSDYVLFSTNERNLTLNLKILPSTSCVMFILTAFG